MMTPATARTRAHSDNAWHACEPTANEFRRLTGLVHEISGISLNETKRALVTHRVSPRVRELGFTTFGEYVEFASAPENGAEMVRLLDVLTTNETQFFREPQHFQYIESRLLPAWREAADAGRRPRVIRVWSAACSTGQEPYSLAMQLLSNCPAEEGWRVDIVATDLSTRALAVAQEAEWPIDRASQIPERYRHEFMLRGVGEREGRMRATRQLRESVQFERLNLNDETYEMSGPFDMIFCRNVLIYFSPEGRAQVVDRLTQYLAPGGLLFVGHAESLHAHRGGLRTVSPTIYERIP
jgi:chemotaxis protein methyltransferase CheR